MLANFMVLTLIPSINSKNQAKIEIEKEKARLERLLNPYELALRKPERDYDSKAEVRYASSNELPEGVLGDYNPSSHTTRIKPNMSGHDEAFVRAHESGHARGIIDESKTDDHAAGKTGFHLRRFRYVSLN